MKTCKILSGVPGSGKNFYIERNFPGAYVCSADDTRMIDGKYVFDKNKLTEDHNKCMVKFTYGITDGKPLVICNNTNVRVYEIAPYYRLAEAFGYEVEVIRLICDVDKAFSRGLHNVPYELIKQMSLGFEPLPPWWKIRQIFQS